MGAQKKKKITASNSSPVPSSLADRTREIDEIFSHFKNDPTPAAAQNPPDTTFSSPRPKPQPDEVLGAAHPALRKDASKNASRKRKAATAGERSAPASGGKPSIEPVSKPRRKTNDGLTIYTEEELGWNKRDAGGTPLCPFDCDCCF